MPPKKLSAVHAAWIAGLIEGEGWIGAVPRGGSRPVVQVASTDEDVPRRLQEWSTVGHVAGPRPPKPGQTKEVWHWKVTRRDDTAWLLRQILPLLCQRRAEAARTVLAAYAAAGPTRGTSKTCGWGHDLTPESGNLRIIVEAGYRKRRCLQCQARRQRNHRARQKERQ